MTAHIIIAKSEHRRARKDSLVHEVEHIRDEQQWYDHTVDLLEHLTRRSRGRPVAQLRRTVHLAALSISRVALCSVL